MAAISAQLALIKEIKEKQHLDDFLKKIIDERESKPRPDFKFENNVLKFQGRLCVPNDSELKRQILQQGHNSKLSIHPGNTKMYQDLKLNFWWPGMKKEIAEFVSKCLHCQQVKAEHQQPAGLLQPLPIPEWKWEHITIDFIVRLPRSSKGMDSIWVIVNRLTKSAHFLPVKIIYNADKLATIYINEIVRLHGVPVSIVFDRDSKFTSRF